MIKTELNIEKQSKEFDWKTAKYPIVGISKDIGIVVLFSGYEEGTALNNARHHDAAEHLTSWLMECFRPLKKGESITLSNDRWNAEKKIIENLPKEPKVGDMCIFWDDDERAAFCAILEKIESNNNWPYVRKGGGGWANCIPFESVEQYKNLIKE